MPQEPNVEPKEAEQPFLAFSADGGETSQPEAAATSLPTTNPSRVENNSQALAQVEPASQATRPNLPILPIIQPAQPLEQSNYWQNNQPVQPSYYTYQNSSQRNQAAMQQPQQWPTRPPMDAARYRYLTTPPPVERPRRVKPQNASSLGAWWGGPLTSGSGFSVKWLWGLAGAIIVLILLWFLLNRAASTVNNPVVQNSTDAVTATLIAAATVPSLSPTPAELFVAANEKWGIVLVDNAVVRVVPVDSAKANQQLKQNTLLAFEKKNNDGWYMLAGGGWIKRENVKVFPSREAALTAVMQFQATATAAAANNPQPATPTALASYNSSPTDLSAKGELTFQTLNCNIKAETAPTNAAKTYYLPGQAAYNVLSMLPPENHRWFCTEQDAVKNGYVKSNSPPLATPVPTPTFGVNQRYYPSARATGYPFNLTPAPTKPPYP